MNYIFFYEWRRVVSQKLMIGILLFIFIGSIVFCLLGDSSVTAQRKQIYNTLTSFSTNEEKLAALQMESDRLESLRTALMEDFSADIGNVDTSLLNSITGDVFSEYTLYQTVLLEAKYLTEYEVYLDNIEHNAKQIGASSFFTDSTSFESRVIAVTPNAYKHLRGINLQIEFPDGAQGVLQGGFQWIGLVFAAVFAATLFSEDIENGSTWVIRATKNGRSVLLTVRLFVLILSSLLMALLLMGIPFVINLFRWGIGDLSRPIQSLPAFFTSPLKLSVGGYMLLQSGALALSVFLTELITVLFCDLLGGSMAVYAGMIGTLSLETLAWLLISRNSFLNPLRYLNLIALSDVESLLADYRALNLFGQPVSLQFALVLTAALALIVLVPMLYRLSFTREPVRISLPKFLQRKKNYHFSLLTKEAYRLFITQKAALVLVVLVGIQWYMYTSFSPAFDQEDMRLRSHITAIGGKLDAAALNYISDKEAHYSGLSESFAWYSQRFADGEITSESYQAISQVIQQQLEGQMSFFAFKQEVERLFAEGKSVILYKTGFDLMLGKTGAKTVAMQGIMAMIFISLSLASIYAADNASGFASLLSSTRRGRGFLLSRKLVLVSWISVFVALVTYVPYILSILKFYGSFQLKESIKLFMGFPLEISILSYIILLIILRVILCILAGVLITFISRLSPNTRIALTISFLITVGTATINWMVA